MLRNQDKELQLAWIVLALSLTLLLASLFPSGLFQQAPYKDVEVLEESLDLKEGYILIANFEKVACAFDSLSVVGVLQGQTKVLMWEDLDDLGKAHNRAVGRQTLRIKANTEGISWDRIEVRTRHRCNDRYVSKVFHTYEKTRD